MRHPQDFKLRPPFRLVAAVGAGLAVVTLFGTFQPALGQGDDAYMLPAGWSSLGHELPDLSLVDVSGKPLRLESLQGRWVWLYMGFARCPDACPIALSYMADEYNRLKDKERVQPLFVSIDPAHDTPEAIGRFARYYEPAMLGATASPTELERLAAGLGTRFTIKTLPGRDPIVSHPEYVFIVNPQGRMVARYHPFRAQAGALARDIDATPPVAPSFRLGRPVL